MKRSRHKGRWLLTAALLFGLGIMISTYARDLLSRAKTGAKIVQNREREIEVLRDIVYRTVDGTDLTLDIFRPKGASEAMPGIVMMHGGAWNSGSKEQVEEIARPVAQQGYVVASINYRLAPRWHFPAPLEDSQAAVRWMRRNAAKYGIRPDRIAAAGFSAGAQLAALLGTTTHVEASEDAASSRVQAVVAVSGPYDFYRFADAPDHPGLAYYFGGTYREFPERYRAASPILLASKESAPFLLLSGAEDPVVLPKNDDLLAEALRKHGVAVETIRVKNAGHVLAPSNGKDLEPSFPMVMLRVADFLNRHIR